MKHPKTKRTRKAPPRPLFRHAPPAPPLVRIRNQEDAQRAHLERNARLEPAFALLRGEAERMFMTCGPGGASDRMTNLRQVLEYGGYVITLQIDLKA